MLRLKHSWRFWARPEQIEPLGNWVVWLLLAGRGYGKTRVGAEWVLERVRQGAKRITLVGRTAADVRDTMVRGESGLLACAHPSERPIYNPSNRRLTWPNGAEALTFSADEPDQMRGPQPDTAWADELAAWQYVDAWSQLMFTLRSVGSGLPPRVVVTTTPRPTDLIKELVASPSAYVTRGSTFDNAANLAPSFIEEIRRRYEGTRLGRQELYADVLADAPGALWKREQIDATRVRPNQLPELTALVVAIDPAVTSGENANETGIIAAGVGVDGHGYVLADLSGRYTPDGWGRAAVKEYHARKANRIVAEVNQGGDLVESNILTVARDLGITVSVTKVHAAQGKRTRAEPVAALYEQGRVHHLGCLSTLEDQQCSWEPDVVLDSGKVQRTASPDRLDALVWALTDLMIDRNPRPGRGGRIVVRPSFDDRTFGI